MSNAVDGLYLVWPNAGFIPEDKVISWAKDLVSDGEAEGPVDTVAQAAAILEDLGVATFRANSVPQDGYFTPDGRPIDYHNTTYNAGYAYACGYHD